LEGIGLVSYHLWGERFNKIFKHLVKAEPDPASEGGNIDGVYELRSIRGDLQPHHLRVSIKRYTLAQGFCFEVDIEGDMLQDTVLREGVIFDVPDNSRYAVVLVIR
jgi:hypothetical protein